MVEARFLHELGLSMDRQEIIEQIKALSDEERDLFLGDLRDAMCLFCGSLDPGCQCWNDE